MASFSVALVLSVLLPCSTAIALAASEDTTADATSDSRGPAGRRHNFWWWLALGVSGFLVLLLLLLLFLSWCCYARHLHRRDQHAVQHHTKKKKKQRLSRDSAECGVGTDDALSTSPDNFTTRHGSHDNRDNEAAVTVSNYVNTARNTDQFGYPHEEENAERSRSRSGPHGRKTIFLAGGGKVDKKKKKNEKTKKAKSKDATPMRVSHMERRSGDTPVATWTNKPRTAAVMPPPLVGSRQMPVLERLPPVEKEMMPEEGISPNPFSPASVRHVEEEHVVEVPVNATGTAVATAATAETVTAAADEKLLVESVRVEKIEDVPVFTKSPTPPPQQQRQPCSRSPERTVVDVPITSIEHEGPRLTSPYRPHQPHQNDAATELQQQREQERHQQQQLQLAKSPMRSSVKAQNITTAEAAPPAALLRGSSKQYFFNYQRKPTPKKNEAVRAPTITTTTTTNTSPQRVSPEQQVEDDAGIDVFVDRATSPAVEPAQQQQQQRLASPQQDRLSPPAAPVVDAGYRGRSPTPPSLLPDQPSSVSNQRNNNNNNTQNDSSTGAGRPSSASPYTSHVFSPLRLSGMEAEAVAAAAAAAASSRNPESVQRSHNGRVSPRTAAAAADPVNAAAVSAAGPLAPSERPPRYEHPSPKPRAPHAEFKQHPQQQHQQHQQSPFFSTAGAAVNSSLEPAPTRAHQHHYSSSGTSTAKKRIELFRKGSHKKTETTSPARTKGRSGSAPAVNGRPPLPSTATQAPIAAATPSYTNHPTSTTVTKGVPQLFFGKRDSSPTRDQPARPSSAQRQQQHRATGSSTAHQRPPRPGSGNPHSQTKQQSSRQVPTTMHLSALQLAQTSPSAMALLPSNGHTSTSARDAAAAALVGGGARPASSRQNSPSHYGSVSSSMNGGGNSPSRTSLGRNRSSSKVKFIDQDGRAEENSFVASGANSATNRAGALTPSVTGGAGVGSTSSTAPLIPSGAHSSGSALKGRPLNAPSGLGAKKESLPDLPPVPATAQVVVEQGRRTANKQPSPPQQQQNPPLPQQQQQQTPLPGTHASLEGPPARIGSVRTSHTTATVTPPFSAKTASPLEAPPVQPLRAVPAVMSPPSSAGVQPHAQAPQRGTSPPAARQLSPPRQPVPSTVRANVPQVRQENNGGGGAAVVQSGRLTADDLESFSSEASTMPAGMLPARQQQGRQVVASPTPPQPQQLPQQQPQPQRAPSPGQQPLFSTISPHTSARRITPAATAAGHNNSAQFSHPRHPSGIAVLRITQASGDVQLLPPPASSSSRLQHDDEHQVVSSMSRFASGQLGGDRGVRDSAMSRSLQQHQQQQQHYTQHSGRPEDDVVAGAGDVLAPHGASASHRSVGGQYSSNRSNHRFGSSTSSHRRPR